jgi:KDO2-lipid IV(A) lauroyltransferase
MSVERFVDSSPQPLSMKETLEYLFFILLNKLARLMSFRTTGRVGSALGSIVFALTSFRKRVTFENLRHAFPQLPETRRREIARGAYRNYATSLLQMLWASGQPEEGLLRVVRVKNKEVLERAAEQGKGVLLLSGHFGGWELLVSAFRLAIGRPFCIIVQHQRNGKIDALIDGYRRRFGNETIPMGPSVREVLKALHEQRYVIMLGDQSAAKESIFVEFFGRPAATHRGAAAFSLKTGAPIVMCFLIRQKDQTYEAVLEDVDRLGLDAYTEENVTELTRRHVALLESYIREHPDHWLWMHKRWKHTGYYESMREHASGAQTIGAAV